MPRRCAAVGAVLVRMTPVFSRVPCQSAKKNVRFSCIGPTQHEAVLIAAENTFRTGGGEQVAGVQLLIAEELERRAMKLIRTPISG